MPVNQGCYHFLEYLLFLCSNSKYLVRTAFSTRAKMLPYLLNCTKTTWKHDRQSSKGWPLLFRICNPYHSPTNTPAAFQAAAPKLSSIGRKDSTRHFFASRVTRTFHLGLWNGGLKFRIARYATNFGKSCNANHTPHISHKYCKLQSAGNNVGLSAQWCVTV